MKNIYKLICILVLISGSNANAASVVQTTRPETRDINRETRQPIQLLAINSADIGTRVSGYVNEVLVDIGDQVAAGDLLARIDAPELAAKKRIALAEKKRQTLLVQSARADFNAAKAEDARVQKLVDSKSLSEKVSLESKSRLAAAKARLASVEAEQEIAEARLEAADALLGFTELRAPFKGSVTARTVDEGDMVIAETSTLFIVDDSSVLRAVTYVPERDAILVDVGDSIVVTLAAFPGKAFESKVSRTSLTVAQGEAHRMRVEADIVNANGELLTGLYGSATITLEKKEQAIVVPAGAVRFGEDPVCVYVVEGGVLRHHPVTIGIDDGQWLEISSGLKGDELLVVDLLGRLPDGAPVSAK